MSANLRPELLESLLDATEPGSMTFHWAVAQLTRGELRAVVELAAVGQAALAGQAPRLVPAQLPELCRQVRAAERGQMPGNGTALFHYVNRQEGATPALRLSAACKSVQASAVAFLAESDAAQLWPRQAVA